MTESPQKIPSNIGTSPKNWTEVFCKSCNKLLSLSHFNCKSCQSNFCSECNNGIISGYKCCLSCKSDFNQLIEIQNPSKDYLSSLIHCEYSNFGCQEISTYKEIYIHKLDCPFTPYTCEKCKKKNLPMNRRMEHKNECEFEEINCPQCKSNVLKNDLVRHLKTKCLVNLISCISCQKEIINEELNKHKQICKFNFFCKSVGDSHIPKKRLNSSDSFKNTHSYHYRMMRREHEFLNSTFEYSQNQIQKLIIDLKENIHQECRILNNNIEQKLKATKEEIASNPIARIEAKLTLIENQNIQINHSISKISIQIKEKDIDPNEKLSPKSQIQKSSEDIHEQINSEPQNVSPLINQFNGSEITAFTDDLNLCKQNLKDDSNQKCDIPVKTQKNQKIEPKKENKKNQKVEIKKEQKNAGKEFLALFNEVNSIKQLLENNLANEVNQFEYLKLSVNELFNIGIKNIENEIKNLSSFIISLRGNQFPIIDDLSLKLNSENITQSDNQKDNIFCQIENLTSGMNDISNIDYIFNILKIFKVFPKIIQKYEEISLTILNNFSSNKIQFEKDYNTFIEILPFIRDVISHFQTFKDKYSSILENPKSFDCESLIIDFKSKYQKLFNNLACIVAFLNFPKFNTIYTCDLTNYKTIIDLDRIRREQEICKNYYLFYFEYGGKNLHFKNMKTSEALCKELYYSCSYVDAAFHQNSIFVCGGYDGNYLNTCIILELGLAGIDKSKTITEEKHSVSLISTGDVLFCIGGNNGKILKSCEYYNKEKSQWIKIPSLNNPDEAITSSFDSTKYIFTIGGNSSKLYERFDSKNIAGKWETLNFTDSCKIDIMEALFN